MKFSSASGAVEVPILFERMLYGKRRRKVLGDLLVQRKKSYADVIRSPLTGANRVNPGPVRQVQHLSI